MKCEGGGERCPVKEAVEGAVVVLFKHGQKEIP